MKDLEKKPFLTPYFLFPSEELKNPPTEFHLVTFFSAGKIINKIGYEKTFAFCFLFYAIRFCALSFIPNPWWVLPIEMIFHGLTFASTYSVIVAYASSLSNSAIRGTMQGIVTGLFDGLGEILTSFSFLETS